MSDTEILKEGELKKYVNMMKGYQKRYFVLNKEMLMYYSSKDKMEETPKKIHLKCASIRPNRNDVITINTGTHNFKLKFKSIADKIEWTNALRLAQAKCESVSDSQSNPDGGDITPGASEVGAASSNSNEEEKDEEEKTPTVSFLNNYIFYDIYFFNSTNKNVVLSKITF